jgi:hypothetical protein
MDISISAQNLSAMKGFYGSFNMGPGLVHGNITSVEIKTTIQFAMHFSVGYFFYRVSSGRNYRLRVVV